MKHINAIIILMLLTISLSASDHGIYLKTHEKISDDISVIQETIAGMSREDDINKCPGIDYAAAYPIKVLIIEEEGKVNVYTQREMFRMDMYFWDAGMSAFMDHMSMPRILEESIKKSLLGNKYKED